MSRADSHYEEVPGRTHASQLFEDKKEAVTELKPEIVMSTLHGTSKLVGAFDFIIIDEAAQSIEALNWVALLRQHPLYGGLTKLLLVGDPHQLPPLACTGPPVGSDGTDGPKMTEGAPTSPNTLRATIFERLAETYCPAGLSATTKTQGPTPLTLLTTQYRFNEYVQQYPNEAMYEHQLQAHPSCASIRLKDLFGPIHPDFVVSQLPSDIDPSWNEDQQRKFCDKNKSFSNRRHDARRAEEALRYVIRSKLKSGPSAAPAPPTGLDTPLAVYDTSQTRTWESNSPIMSSQSFANPAEVDVALRHVMHLLRRGVKPEQIAIISPYQGQISTLHESLLINPENGNLIRLPKYLPGITIGTADSVQGNQAEVVIFLSVRSNPERRIGFLADAPRLNVAMTRARRQLCIVGNMNTLHGSPVDRRRTFLRKWIEHLDWHAEILLV